MKKPIVRIYTGAEITDYVDREMNDAEYAVYQADQQVETARQAEGEAKAQAKATAEGKLAALGLTTDDLRALGL